VKAPGATATNRRLGRAFRGLLLTFLLSFVNLIGLVLTTAALGGLSPWTRWQFIGAFGVIESAAGLANVISPNIWHLPVAKAQTSKRTDVRLAASVLLLPHWGGFARCLAGLVCLALAGWQSGLSSASVGLVVLVLALASSMLAISAALARAGVARPDLDVLQLAVRWRDREREVPPISLSAAAFQFILAVATIPAVKVLAPSVLYQPEIAPSTNFLLVTLAASVALLAVVYALWLGRVGSTAPAEQQREAEESG
jgi:hypothetical protein